MKASKKLRKRCTLLEYQVRELELQQRITELQTKPVHPTPFGFHAGSTVTHVQGTEMPRSEGEKE